MKDKTNFLNIVIYIFLVFVLSGLFLILHSVFENAGDYSLTFPQFAPALALVILLAIRKCKGVSFNVKRSFSMNKRVLFYCLCSMLFVLAVFCTIGFLSDSGRPFTKWETPSLVISLLCMTAGCFGEEIGWRGFLLPASNRNLSLITSALIIGVIWGVWHMNFEKGIIGYLTFILFTTSLSVIMSWVQAKSGGSIVPAIVLHFFVNLSASTILFGMSLSVELVLSGTLACFSLVLFFVDRKTFISKTNQPLSGNGMTTEDSLQR